MMDFLDALAGLGEEDLIRLQGAPGLTDKDRAIIEQAIQRTPPSKEWQAGAPERTRAKAELASDLAGEQYRRSDMGAPSLLPGAPSPYAPPGIPPIQVTPAPMKALGQQAIGTAAAATNIVPGLKPTIEGLAGRPVIEEAIETAPSPGVARATPLVAGYMGLRGALGGAGRKVTDVAFAPYTGPYGKILSATQKALPKSPMLPHVAAGAGSAGLVAADEAVLKRAGQLVGGHEVEPMTLGEIAAPAAAGAALGGVPGFAAKLRNPATEGGRITQRYAKAQKSGTAKQVAEEEANVPISGREPEPPLKRAQREAEGTIETAALEAEPRFSAGMTDAEKLWMEEGFGPAFAKIAAPKRRVDPSATIADLDALIETKASQAVTGGTGEEYLDLGGSLKTLRDKFATYLGEGATVRDYKNAIDEATKLAEMSRTSKVAERAFGDVEGILRKHAYEAFPEYGKLAMEHKAFQGNIEKQAEAVYGKATHQREDYEAGTRQARGRRFLKSLAEGTPESETAAKELAGRSPYGRQAVGTMREAEAAARGRFGEREAIERSRFYPVGDWAHDAALMGGGMAIPSAHGVSMAVRGATHLIPRLRQPLRSRLGNLLPETETLETGVQRYALPGLMGILRTKYGGKDYSDDFGDMLDKAREKGAKLIGK